MLLQHRGALPFLIAVFLNAFVDLGHKIVVQNTIFKVYDGAEQVVLTAVLNALILLPYVLLFSAVGFMADRFAKAKILRWCASLAVVLTCAITLFYWLGWFWLAFAMTLLMGVQSAFYYPAKYGYLKQLFGQQKLAAANGALQAVTIIAILVGTFAFSIVFEILYSPELISKDAIVAMLVPIGFLLIISSVVQWVMAMRLPIINAGDASQRFDLKATLTGRSLLDYLQPLSSRRVLRYTIFGVALFWSCGQVMLAAFPAFAKDVLSETNTVVIQAILASSGIGIGLGSWLAGRLSRNYIEAGLIPLGGFGFAVGLCVLPLLTNSVAMIICFLWIGFMGGLFLVPLNALLQFHAEEYELGRILATSSLLQNIAMLILLLITAMFSLWLLSPQLLLQLIAVIAVLGSAYIVWSLPQSRVSWQLLKRFGSYRVQISGINHITGNGGLLLMGELREVDHALLLQKACPRQITFVAEATQLSQLQGSPKALQLEMADNKDELLTIIEKLLLKNKAVAVIGSDVDSKSLLTSNVNDLPFSIVNAHGSRHFQITFGADPAIQKC